MIKTISTAFAAFAVVTFVGFSNQATAQDCSSCGSASSFSYPAAAAGSSCGPGGCLAHGGKKGHGHGGRIQELKNQIDHQSEIFAKAAARNDAWPKPFSCYDKRSVHEVWHPMLAAGNESQQVLDHNFFTSSNQLNRVGIDRLAGIALNGVPGERAVYVTRSADQAVDEARIAAIRDTISTYYAHRGGFDVRLSDRTAPTVAAVKVQAANDSYNDNRPPGTIFGAEAVGEAVQSQ